MLQILTVSAYRLSYIKTGRLTVNLLIFSLIILFSVTQKLTATELNQSTQTGIRLKKSYSISFPEINITDVIITNTTNNKRNLKTELNKGPVIINFIFTSCNAIRPILASTFSQLQKRYKEITIDNLNLISFSIDPEHDTPTRLRDYAKQFNAGPYWNFYTETKADMLKIENMFGNYRGSKMNHLPYTFIRINKNSKWVQLTGFAKTTDIIKEVNHAASTK